MGGPKRFLTRLPLVPEPRHNQLRECFFTNPGEFPEGVGMPELTKGNLNHGWLQPRGEVGSRRGE
eukprot:7217130-Pyramimonas_sp.AAC.1